MKKNYLLVFITTFLLTFISVAYAAFNSELTISGSGIVEKDTTPPTCGTWYLRDSNLTIQEAYNQNKFTNPSTNTSWTTTNQKLFIECSDNMPGSYGCIDVTEITDSNNNPRYFKEVKEYTTSIKTDSEVITVKLKDAYLNEKTCTLPVGGSNPYIDKQAPVVTITQTAANKFTYSATDDLGVTGYQVTTNSTQPTTWLTTPAEVTIDNTAAKTYYVWAKDGVNVSYQTINTYLLTRTQGTGTTLTLKYNNNSGTPITNSMYVLSGTPVYVTGSLSTGYNTLVLKKGSTTITSPSTQTVSSATTISSSASANTYTVSYDANGGSGTMASQVLIYNANTSLTTNTFTRSGYTFAGWNTASDGTGTNYSDGQTKPNITSTNNGTVTLYAKWTVNQYTLTINPNSGIYNNTSSNTVVTQDYGTTYNVYNNATRDGYIFAGWKLTSGNGDIQYFLDGELLKQSLINSPTASKPSIYNNKGNGTVTHTIIEDETSSTGYSLQITTNGEASPYAGGFYNGVTATAGAIYYHKIVAKVPVGYKLNIASNTGGVGYGSYWLTGNSGTGDWETYIYIQYDGYNGPFSSFGHVYLSGSNNQDVTWYINECSMYRKGSNLSQVQESSIIFGFLESNATLTAQWSASGATVTWDKQGGTFGNGTIGTKWTAASSSYRYLFDYAAIKKAPYYIDNNTFTIYKTGYTFDGWYTSSTGGTQIFNASGQLNPSVSGYSDANRKWLKYDSNVTLYARWIPNTYTLTADANNGSIASTTGWTGTGEFATKTVTYDAAYGTLPTVTRAGYTFDGWTTDYTGYKYSAIISTTVIRLSTETNYSSTTDYWQVGDILELDLDVVGTTITSVDLNDNDITPNCTITGGTNVKCKVVITSAMDVIHRDLYYHFVDINNSSSPTSYTVNKLTLTKSSITSSSINYIDTDHTITAKWVDDTPPTKPTVTLKFADNSGTYTSGTWTNKQVITQVSSIEEGSGITSIPYNFAGTWTAGRTVTQSGNTYTKTEYWTVTNGRDVNVVFKAIDAAGNESEESDSVNIKYDTDGPTITASNITYGSDLSITLDDPYSGVTGWQVTNSSTAPTSGWTAVTKTASTTVTKTGLAAGTYYIWAKDDLGNTNSKQITVNRQGIAFPTCSDKAYTASEQTLFDAHTSGSYTNNAIKGTTVGGYTGALTPTSNYQWNSGSDVTAARILTCNIVKSNTTTTASNVSQTYSGSAITGSATAKLNSNNTNISGGAISYTYYNGSSCSGTALSSAPTNWRDGGYSYTATLTGTANYNTSTSACATLVINKATNPMTFTTPQSGSVTYSTSSQDRTFTAAASAQGTVTYSITSQKDSNNTTVSYFTIAAATNTTAKFTVAANTPAGTYTIKINAHAAGGTNYNTKDLETTYTLTIGPAPCKLAVSNPANKNPDDTYNLSTLVTANAGTVTYALKSGGSNTTTPSTLSGSTLTIGAMSSSNDTNQSVDVQFTDPGSNDYEGCTIEKSVTVKKKTNTLAANNQTVYVSSTTALSSFIKNNNGGTVSYTKGTDNTSGSSINGSNFIAGTLAANDDSNKTVTITATSARTTKVAASGNVTITVTVQKYTRGLTLTINPTNVKYNQTATLSTSNTGSGGTPGTSVTYTSSNTNVFTVTGSTIKAVSYTGSSDITATRAGSTTVKAATATATATATQSDCLLTVSNSSMTTGSNLDLTTLTSNAVGNVTFAIKTNGTTTASTLSGSTLTAGAMSTSNDTAQTVVVTATEAATDYYTSCSKDITLTVNKQTNTLAANNQTVYVSSSTALSSLTKNNIGGTLSATITTDNTAGSSISGTNFNAGVLGVLDDSNKTVVMTVTSARTATVAQKSVTVTATVQKYTRALNITTPTANQQVEYNKTITAASTNGGSGGTPGAVTYSSSNTSVFTVDGTTIKAVGTDGQTATIGASRASTSTVKAATATAVTVKVIKNQTCQMAVSNPSSKNPGNTYNLSTLVSGATGTVTYALKSGGNNTTTASTLSGSTLTIGEMSAENDNDQTVDVQITDAGSNRYVGCTIEKSVTVKKYTRTIAWSSSTPAENASLAYGTSYTATATASGSGGTAGTISYSSNNTSGATINSSTGVITVAGVSQNVTITASLSRTTTVKAASITRTYTTTKGTCPAPTNVTIATDKKVSWTNATGASSYQISMNASSGFAAHTNGAVYNSITDSTGTRTVYVRSVCSTSYYTSANSSNASASTTVYSVSLTKGTGISAVSGAGNYITGTSVPINATVSDGYTWNNWTGSSTITTKSTSITVNANKSYTANATANTYTVNFNKNATDAVGVMSGQIMTYDQSYNLTTNNYSRSGYEFAGWNTNTSGTGTNYSDAQSVSNLTTSGTFDLYAKWTKKIYTISYALNGGTVEDANPTVYGIDSPLITLNNPTKTGYTFTGWTEKTTDLDWYKGFVNFSSGAIENNSSYPNSYYTDLIYLKAGVTYTISGGPSNLRWRKWNIDGITYEGNASNATSYTPNANCYVRILFYDNPTAAQMTNAVITNNATTTATIPTGSTGNKTFIANFTIDDPATPTVTGNGTRVYNYAGRTLTCSTTSTYASGTSIYYQFGYATSAANWNAGTITWIGSASTTKTYEVSKDEYFGTRYYGCVVYASDGTSTSSSIKSASVEQSFINSRLFFDVATNGGTRSGSANLYTSYGLPNVYTGRTNQTAGSIPTATKTGYTFTGWYTAASGGAQIINASGTVQASVSEWTDASKNWLRASTSNNDTTNVLYAQFIPNELTFSDKTITGLTYDSINVQTVTNGVDEATNGTGSYTYTIVGGNTDNYFSLSGRNIVVDANTPANTSGYQITIRATDDNSLVYKDAAYTIKIAKAENTLSVSNITVYAGSTGNSLSAKVSNAIGTVSYEKGTDNTLNSGSSVNASTGAFTAGVLPALDDTNKTVTVSVTAEGNANYASKTLNITVTVQKYTRALTITTPTANQEVEYNKTITASSTNGGSGGTPGSVTYSSSNTSVFTVTGTTIKAVGTNGQTATIGASRAGSTTVKAATATAVTVKVIKNQTCQMAVSNPASKNPGNIYDLSTLVSGATGTVTYALKSGGNNTTTASTLSGSTLTIGAMSPDNDTDQTVDVQITDAGNDRYVGCTVEKSVTVQKYTRALTITTPTANQEVEYNKTVTAASSSASGSGTLGSVTYSSSNTSVFTVSGTTITAVAPSGSATITASRARTSTVKAASATVLISAKKATCPAPTNVAISTAGVVTWTAATGASSYQISMSETSGYTAATSGVNYNSSITDSTGTRTVYVRSVCDTTYYSSANSTPANKSTTVYSLTLTKGTGINTVSGAGNYITGSSVGIDATLKTGYTWSNWTGSSTISTKSTSVNMNANKSYTANATATTYTIGYTLNGGSVSPANPTSYTVESNAITLTNPTKTGYTFTGWTGSNGTTPQTSVTIAAGSTGNKSYTANYSIDNPATPTISGNGNRVYNYSSRTLTCSTTTTYASGTNIYYQFGYSETAAEYTAGTITWIDSASTTNTLTVQANEYLGTRYWGCRVYASDGTSTTSTITATTSGSMSFVNARLFFDVATNGGTRSGSANLYVPYGLTNIYTGRLNQTAGTIPTATKTGYTFTGWYTASSGGSQVINASGVVQASVSGWTDVSKNWLRTDTSNQDTAHVLYAQFTANTYTIAYAMNYGGNPNPKPTTGTYDSDVVIGSTTMPSKSITVTGNANNSGATVGSATVNSQTFTGWTSSTSAGLGSGAKTGTSASPSTTWTGTATTNKYFRNLRDTSGTVTLTANWSGNITLPTLSKTNNICNWYASDAATEPIGASGESIPVASNSSTSITVFAKCIQAHYKIGNNYYVTLADALDAASATGTTIVVIDDHTDTSTVSIDSSKITSVTLNTNGKTITRNGNQITVGSGVTLNIAGSGGISFTGDATGGKLINNGTITLASAMLTKAGERVVENNGIFTMNSGTIKSTTSYQAVYNSSTGTFTINNGTIEINSAVSSTVPSIVENYGILNIAGGSLNNIGTVGYGIKNYGTGVINMTGGTVQAKESSLVGIANMSGTATLNMSGGTVNSEGIGLSNEEVEGSATINLTGGTVIANIGIMHRGGTIIIGNLAETTVSTTVPSIQAATVGIHRWNGSSVVTFLNGEIISETAEYAIVGDYVTRTGYFIKNETYNTDKIRTYLIQGLAVTLDPNGGSVSPSTVYTLNGREYGELPTPTRTGYRFDGWYIDNSDYEFIEYIETTGTQYINTGVSTGNIYGLEFKYTPVGNVSTYDSYLAGTLDNFTLGRYTSNTTAYLRLRGTQISVSLTVDNNAVNRFSYLNKTITHNNQTFTTQSSGKIETAASTLYIANNNSSSRLAKIRIYGLTLYSDTNGTVYRNFIPAINKSTGKAGLYDSVTNTFKGNSGTGDLIAGPSKYITENDIVNIVTSHTLKAHWTKCLTVTFDADGGSVSPSSKNVITGDAYGELPTPTKEGYAFRGWSGLPDTYQEYDNIQSSGTQYIDSNYTFTGLAGTIESKFSFTNIPSSSYGYVYGTEATSSPYYALFARVGSSSNFQVNAFGSSVTNTITTGTTYTVNHAFTPRTNTVTINGTTSTTTGTEDINQTNLYIFADHNGANAERFGKLKLHYLKMRDENGNNVRQFVPAKNLSTKVVGLYDVITQEFYTNSGTGLFTANTALTPAAVTASIVDANTTVGASEDHTLSALWTPTAYSITYNLNGGYQSSGSACASENGTCSFTGTKFVCYGGANNYVCKNATTSIACTTAAFGSDPTPGLAKSCYVSNNPVAYDVETATITLAAPTKSGSTFTGWTGSNGSTPQTSVTIPVGSTGNKTYTANWSTTNYTLTARTTYGTINATSGWTKVSNTRYTKTLANGSLYGTLPTATRSGYLLKGWYTASSGGTQVTQATIISGNTTIYAQWTKVDSTSKTFSYTGAVQTYVAPSAGTYKLEVCGAQGGSPSVAGYTRAGGNGGCATGNVSLSAGQTLYVFVGGKGNTTNGNSGAAAGGWNGGGATGGTNSATWFGSGGGATHISKSNATIANAGNNLLIVGGGGGGGLLYYASDGTNTSLWFNGVGGAGGGSSGGTGVCHDERNGQCYGAAGTGGSQSGPGGGGASGSKGQGGTSNSGGGGGFYGGGGGNAAGAGGGSGYVGGVSSASWSSSSCQNSGTTRTGNGCAKITKQ